MIEIMPQWLRRRIERAPSCGFRVTRWKPRTSVLDRNGLPEVGQVDESGLRCDAVDFENGVALWVRDDR